MEGRVEAILIKKLKVIFENSQIVVEHFIYTGKLNNHEKYNHVKVRRNVILEHKVRKTQVRNIIRKKEKLQVEKNSTTSRTADVKKRKKVPQKRGKTWI